MPPRLLDPRFDGGRIGPAPRAHTRGGGAAAQAGGTAAPDPRPGPAVGERRQHPQSLRAPDLEGRRARPRAGTDRDRSGALRPRPAGRGPARAGPRRAFAGADALRTRGQGRRWRRAAARAAAEGRAAAAFVDPSRQLIETVSPATLRAA